MKLDSALQATGFTVSGNNITTVAAAGIQDRVNDGAAAYRSSVTGAPGALADFAVGTNSLTAGNDFVSDETAYGVFEALEEADGKKTEVKQKKDKAKGKKRKAAAKAETEKETEKPQKRLSAGEISGCLEGLAASSLSLANAVSTSDVTVVNLYADENGQFSAERLSRAGSAVSGAYGKMTLINVIAAYPGQSLVLPSFGLAQAAGAQDDSALIAAGSVVYNRVNIYDNEGEGSSFKPEIPGLELKGRIIRLEREVVKLKAAIFGNRFEEIPTRECRSAQ